MMRYSVQPRDRVFVKGHEFLSFAKSMGKNISKNISKNVIGKCSQKLLDHAKQSATDAIKTTLKRVIQKSTEVTGYLIGNETANRIKQGSKNPQQNNSEAVTNEHDKEIPKERYISLEETIDDLRLI